MDWDPRAWSRKKICSGFVDNIIAISQTASREFGFDTKTNVIYDWPDFVSRDGYIDIRKKYNIAADKKILLVMGGRTPIKGSKTAMLAMQYIKDKDAVLLVLGGMADKSPIKKNIRRLLRKFHIRTYGLTLDYLANISNDRIIITDNIKNIKGVIEDSTMILCPFTTPHFAMPILEAGCLRKPVIASATGHAEELIIDGITGIIVKVGNTKELANAINKLLLSPETTINMGIAANKYIQSNFTKEKSISALKKIFATA
jgi:glycosyltransferase involved in cell wall biosynthesis